MKAVQILAILLSGLVLFGCQGQKSIETKEQVQIATVPTQPVSANQTEPTDNNDPSRGPIHNAKTRYIEEHGMPPEAKIPEKFNRKEISLFFEDTRVNLYDSNIDDLTTLLGEPVSPPSFEGSIGGRDFLDVAYKGVNVRYFQESKRFMFIIVTDPKVVAQRGIRIGSTKEEVASAFAGGYFAEPDYPGQVVREYLYVTKDEEYNQLNGQAGDSKPFMLSGFRFDFDDTWKMVQFEIGPVVFGN